MRTLALVILMAGLFMPQAAFAQTVAIDGREEFCGWGFPVSAYVGEVGGLEIELPSPGHLIVNGQSLVEGDGMPWEDSHNVAYAGRVGDDIVIVTVVTDCLDYAQSLYFILDAVGRLRTHGELWTEHSEYAFVRIAGGIAYWSDWFCDPNNPDREFGRPYWMVLRDGEAAFVRDAGPPSNICEPNSWMAQPLSPMRPL